MTAKKEYSDAALRACKTQLLITEKEIRELENRIEPIRKTQKLLQLDMDNLKGAIKIMEGIYKKPEEKPQIQTIMYQPPERPRCKKCQSEKLHKSGYKKQKGGMITQVWRCLECNHKFTLPMETFEISNTPRKLNVDTRVHVNARESGKHTGKIQKHMVTIKERIDRGESVLYKNLASDLGDSVSVIWIASNNLIEEHPETYEQYKDITKKYNIKGIRLVDPEKRINTRKSGAFCPKCKTLLIPGENCKKCRS